MPTDHERAGVVPLDMRNCAYCSVIEQSLQVSSVHISKLWAEGLGSVQDESRVQVRWPFDNPACLHSSHIAVALTWSHRRNA